MPPRSDASSAVGKAEDVDAREKTSEGDALIELGVKTGLSLVFTLLRQQWTFASVKGSAVARKTAANESLLLLSSVVLTAYFHVCAVGDATLCHDVLRTALVTLKAFPPLSLANETKINTLGRDVLVQVSEYDDVFSYLDGITELSYSFYIVAF